MEKMNDIDYDALFEDARQVYEGKKNNDLFTLIDRCVHDTNIPLYLNVEFNKESGWKIFIWQRTDLYDEMVCLIRGKRYGACCKKAYAAVKDWLQENKGGY